MEWELLKAIINSSVPVEWQSPVVARFEFNEVSVRVWFGGKKFEILRIQWSGPNQSTIHILRPKGH